MKNKIEGLKTVLSFKRVTDDKLIVIERPDIVRVEKYSGWYGQIKLCKPETTNQLQALTSWFNKAKPFDCIETNEGPVFFRDIDLQSVKMERVKCNISIEVYDTTWID